MERRVQQKLPLWRVIRETFAYLGDHGGRLLATAPQLVAILIAGTTLGKYLDQMAVAQQSMLLQLAGWLVNTAAPVLAAVAWHRHILLNEHARSGIATGKPERMYFVVAAAGSAALFALSLVSFVVARLTAGPEGLPAYAMALQFALGLLPAYFVGHFFLALPHAALTGRLEIRRIAALTRGNKLRFVGVALVPVPILLLLELVRVFLLQMPRTPSAGYYVYGTVVVFVTALISVTSMSVCYRTLVFSPTGGTVDAPDGETAAAEG